MIQNHPLRIFADFSPSEQFCRPPRPLEKPDWGYALSAVASISELTDIAKREICPPSLSAQQCKIRRGKISSFKAMIDSGDIDIKSAAVLGGDYMMRMDGIMNFYTDGQLNGDGSIGYSDNKLSEKMENVLINVCRKHNVSSSDAIYTASAQCLACWAATTLIVAHAIKVDSNTLIEVILDTPPSDSDNRHLAFETLSNFYGKRLWRPFVSAFKMKTPPKIIIGNKENARDKCGLIIADAMAYHSSSITLIEWGQEIKKNPYCTPKIDVEGDERFNFCKWMEHKGMFFPCSTQDIPIIEKHLQAIRRGEPSPLEFVLPYENFPYFFV